MRLNNLTMKNFRLFPEFKINFHQKLTVIVAQNGGGKTTILDAIRIAYGPFLSVFPTGRGSGVENSDVRQLKSATEFSQMSHVLPVEILVNGEFDTNEPNIWQRGKASLKGKTSIKDARPLSDYAGRLYANAGKNENWPLIAYYGTGRLWNQLKLTERKIFSSGFNFREAGYLDCMEPASSYKFFVDWFRYVTRSDGDMKLKFIEKNPSATAEQIAEFKGPFSVLVSAVRQAVNTVLNPTGWGSMGYSMALGDVTIEHPEFGILAVSQMSDGIRNSFALAADIAWRCVQLNAHLGDKAVNETEGIVLIDEVDMHLHPEWQQLVLKTLRDAFPAIQFIVSTHSPQVLTTVPAECIRIIEDGQPHSAPPGTEGAEASRTLKRVLGVDARPSENSATKELKEYLALVDTDQWETPRALELRGILDARYQGEEPALVDADLLIENRKWELGR